MDRKHKIKVPVKFIIWGIGYGCTHYTRSELIYVHGGGFKKDVPLPEDVIVMEGVGHLINQERVRKYQHMHIHDFIKKF
ncbi:hypothetical protein Leryth_017849 [Lithospermum erythrorhizon]|nr:hypothetical protein Leryth_017849 [Lithospermum erythrorhizon]